VSWRLTFSRNAQRDLRRLPPDVRRRLDGVFVEMAREPLSGDVVVLRDFPVGYRRRVGPYRVLFDVDQATRNVQIQNVERRTSTTYRKRR
jgi:mRNA interferase RelE/StbE